MLSKLQSTPSIDSFYEVFFGSCFTFFVFVFNPSLALSFTRAANDC